MKLKVNVIEPRNGKNDQIGKVIWAEKISPYRCNPGKSLITCVKNKQVVKPAKLGALLLFCQSLILPLLILLSGAAPYLHKQEAGMRTHEESQTWI